MAERLHVSFAWSSAGPPPAADEIEVSVFGPGKGECIVLHVGNGRWVVVDSCIEPGDSWSVAERYLRGLGVALESQVDMVVATHWHDDHIGGIARLLEQCKAAQFACSAAMSRTEFWQYVMQMGTGSLATDGAKVREFTKVLAILESEHRLPLRAATESCELRTWPANQMPHGERCLLRSFSPSDLEHQLFLQWLATMKPAHMQPTRSAVDPEHNVTAVVLHLQFSSCSVLLGADMEIHGDPRRGWAAVVATALAREAMPAAVNKVAHHGSINGYLEEAWIKLLEAAPVSVVTPYNRLPDSRKLPTANDVQRMRSRGRLLQTSPHAGTRIMTRDPGVARGLRESNIELRDMKGELGMVRFRRRLGAASTQWAFELHGAAFEHP